MLRDGTPQPVHGVVQQLGHLEAGVEGGTGGWQRRIDERRQETATLGLKVSSSCGRQPLRYQHWSDWTCLSQYSQLLSLDVVYSQPLS